MSKKKATKKKAIHRLLTDSFLSPEEEFEEENRETTPATQAADPPEPFWFPGILDKRISDRDIPLADEFISESSVKNPTPEVLDEWYRETNVGKYVHVEIVNRDGFTFPTKRIQFEFGRMLEEYGDNLDERGVNPAIERFTFAKLLKNSFINNVGNPLRHINYFIEYFDDDDELLRAYFMMMFHIGKKETVVFRPQEFIDMIHATFTTDTMVEKVHRMVEHNVDPSLVKKTDQAFDESIQLTVEHMKAIMGVGCLVKFTIPVVSHYCSVRGDLLEQAGITEKEFYYYIFAQFSDTFDRIYGVRLYDKLYYISTTRITKTINPDKRRWVHMENSGVTPISCSNELIREMLTDILQKTAFKMSAITYINVCMDQSVHTTLIGSDPYDYSEMQMVSSDSVNETMSEWDRWQTDKSYHSQLRRIRSDVSIRDSIERFGRAFGMDFAASRVMPRELLLPKDRKTLEDFEYYRDNIQRPFDKAQLRLVKRYYSSLVGNYTLSDDVEPADLIRLIMIMKEDFSARNYVYLPFFVSGKVNAAAGKKVSRKRVEKLVTRHPLYEDLLEEYRDAGNLMDWNEEFDWIGAIISKPIIVVDRNHPEMEGMLMRPDENCVVDEIMRFYDSL